MKICWHCKKEKPKNDFYRDRRKKDGLQAACKQCQQINGRDYREAKGDELREKKRRAYHQKYYSENKARYQRYREDYRARRKAALQTVRGRLMSLRDMARDRAARYGLEFSIDIDWLLEQWQRQEGRCALTGLEMTLEIGDGSRRYIPFNPSLDRIDPKKGYTKENTRLVCTIVNIALNQFGEDAFARMCFAYTQQRKDNEQ